MKKLTLFFFSLLALGLSFQACDDSMTYAEMLEREKNAIEDFITERDFKVITQEDFFAKDSMTAENEYVKLNSGVYLNIVSKGRCDESGALVRDTVRNNDQVLVRFTEYSLFDKDTTISNVDVVEYPDEFQYRVSETQIAGSFTSGFMQAIYGPQVPAGWLVPLPYIYNRAHIRLIVPSKMGHSQAMQYVYPYYYDIQKYQFIH